MAALLTIEAANTDKLAMYLGECRELGVPILPPDINASELAFTVGPRASASGCARSRTSARAQSSRCSPCARSSGRSTRCITLCEHADLRLVNKRVLESLVKAGALDSLAPACRRRSRGRARLFAAVDRAIEHGNRHQRDRDKGQHQLFGGTDGGRRRRRRCRCRTRVAWPEAQQLAFEKEALGLYMSGHPLDRFAEETEDVRRQARRPSWSRPKRTSGSAASSPGCAR